MMRDRRPQPTRRQPAKTTPNQIAVQADSAAENGHRLPIRRRFTRTDVNFWLDSMLLAVFLGLIFVTVVLRFIFPAIEDARQWTLWSWSMTEWMGAQFVLLCVFALGILVHLMLHWTWICGVLTQRVLPRRSKGRTWNDGMRTIFGVGLMIVILNVLGGLIAAAALMVKHP